MVIIIIIIKDSNNTKNEEIFSQKKIIKIGKICIQVKEKKFLFLIINEFIIHFFHYISIAVFLNIGFN